MGDVRAVEDVATRGELGALLSDLRERSGKTVRDLTRATGISRSTVDDWCKAKRLPFRKQDAAFERMLVALDIDDPEPLMVAMRRMRGDRRRSRRDDPAPYRGLNSFRADDRELFFGRDDLVERMHDRFRSVVGGADRPRLLFIVGASGSGKSSALYAGLVPTLRGDGFTTVSLTPGARPLRSLAAALADQAGMPVPADDLDGDAWAAWFTDVLGAIQADGQYGLGHAGELQDDSDPTGPADAQRTHVDAANGDSRDAGVAIVVDQFEELFTACDEDSEQTAFLAALTRLASGRAPLVAVVVGLRVDFYPALVATGQWTEALQDAQVLVEPMARAQLTAAIVEPARRVGFSVDDALVELILHEFIPPGSIDERHDPGALPLLSHALLETWHHASRGRMTVDDYRAAGGIRRAVEDSAEHAFGELDDDARAAAQRTFLRLVNIDPHDVATRRAARRDELTRLAPRRTSDVEGNGEDGGSPLLVLAPFVDARLVTAHESTVEITHEALLAAWPRLRGWIDEDREAIVGRQRIGDAAQVWLDHDRDPSALASGNRLAAMQEWATGEGRQHLSDDERGFLDASVERADAEERVRRRRFRRVLSLAAVAVVLALIAGSLAFVARDRQADAVAARDEALSRQLALASDALRDTDPSVAAHLALRGYQVAPTAQARAALLETADRPFTTRYAGAPGPTAVAASSRDGVVAVSNAVDSTVQLFTQTSSDEGGVALDRRGTIEVGDSGVVVYALALTPDEGVLAVGDTTAAVNLWDVTDPDAPRHLAGPLTGLEGPVQHLDIAPDGTELAATGLGPGVVRWDIADPASPEPLPTIPSDATTFGIAYSPDGSHLAFGQETGHLRLWRLPRTPAEVATMQIGDGEISTVAFSPDGATIAGGGKRNEARAWDITDPATPAAIDLPDNTFGAWINAAAFDQSGNYLVAGSSDGALRVWHTSDWSVAGTLPHPDALTQVAFTRESAALVTVAADGVARVWDMAAAASPTLDARVFTLTFSDDATRLAAFTGDDTGVWDVSDPERPDRLVKVTSPDPDEAFTGAGDMTGDGTLLVHGGVAGSVFLIDISDPADPRPVGGPLGGSDALVEQTSFNSDGTLLAAAADDGTVRIWDVADPDEPRLTATLNDSSLIMLNVVWSPTEPLLAANSSDGLTYLYDVADPDHPELLATLDGFDSDSYASAFTADGQTLAVGGSDRVVILWDVGDPASPSRIGDPITGPPSRIYNLAFSSDGSALIGAVIDGTAWVWDTSDLESPRRTAVLGPYDGPTFTVAVSPDGSLVAASGADQQVHLYPTDEDAVIADVCSRLGDPLTEDEWLTHMPDEPFEPPC